MSSRPIQSIERFLLSPFSLLLALLIAFFLNAYSLPLTDVDEGAFSEATREMMARGNLISPTLNDAPRHDKPILIYWAQAASVSVLGVSEIGFRLPSIIFSVLWMLALYRFCRRHGNQMTAQVAALVMALTLVVGIVAKAAIADALLNLLIALAMFGIYDFFCACREGKGPAETRRLLFGIYAALGLGFLAKGPVAVFFPLVISAVFFVSAGAWRHWLRAIFFWPGWLLFLAIVVPWHVLVYLDQGDAFFRGFYLKHNINRYADTFEGHGGRWWYYFAVLPLILLPFTGWLFAIVGKLASALRQGDNEALFERFLVIWFVVVFAFFSTSGTQLPHYLLYGCTPIFILLARHRLDFERRWLAFAPIILFALLLAALPEVLAFATGKVTRPFELTLLSGLTAAFADEARWLLPLLAVAVVGLACWRRLPVWQGLVLAGILQALTVAFIIAPRVIGVTQGPVREAAMIAKQRGEPVVAWRIIMPSFSVYRQAATPTRVPELGQLVFTRTDRKSEVQALLPPDLVLHDVYQRSFVTLARVEREEKAVNDQGLHARHPAFDATILAICLLFAAALAGLALGGDWYAGFIPAQAASTVLPGWLWESLTTLGDGRVQLALMLPFCLRYPRVFWALVVGALLAGMMSRGLKVWFDLPRPAAVLDASQITIVGARLTSHSFPSGHTVSAFSFVVAWLALLGWWRALPIVTLAVLVGFSRIAVGAHWPVDVLAGALIGLAGGWAGLRLSRRFRWGLGIGPHWALVSIAVIAVATLPFDGQGYPDTLPWRIVASAWGLGGFALVYLLPWLRDGWQSVNRPLAGVVDDRCPP